MTSPGLTARVAPLLGRRHTVWACATITPEGTDLAHAGADLDADFEIGSVSKGVTGLLYADALERGEIHTGSTLGDHLPLGTAPAAGVTLASIAVHRSGLPRLPYGPVESVRRTAAVWRRGTNPYGETLAELLGQMRHVPVRSTRPRYSNLGFELLGHAVAAAAGTTYPDLVRTRLAEPLRLGSVQVPRSPDDLRGTAVAGRSRSGRSQDPWTGEALGPAGGIRASVADMARLTGALLDGSAPGTSALDPVSALSGRAVRIGAAWITLDVKGRRVTWHNGGTGGFRSWMGIDREAGTGAVVLSATATSVDRQGFDLLTGLAA